MRLALLKTNSVPPDGFRYVFPDDGFVVHAWSYDAWVQVARDHLIANNLSIPEDLQAQMEEQLCQTQEPGWCSYDDPNRPRVSTILSWGDVLSALTTFARWIAGGCQYVSQDEANRRALICSRCYMNTFIGGCSNCEAAVAKVTGKVSTKYDFALKACAVCKCVLRAKVHFPLDTLAQESENLQELYPPFCWNKKGGVNYKS
jgi:hypothetical protein